MRRAVAFDQARAVRQEPHEFLEGARSTHHRAHLDPVAEQHDQNERHQLPVELLTRKAERDGSREKIRCGDRERDQGHHAGLPLAQLGNKSGQKWPAAIEIGDGREPEEHEAIAGKSQGLVQTEPVLDHRRQQQHWWRQNQRDPEAATKIRNHRGMVMHPVARLLRVAGRGAFDAMQMFAMPLIQMVLVSMAGRPEGDVINHGPHLSRERLLARRAPMAKIAEDASIRDVGEGPLISRDPHM